MRTRILSLLLALLAISNVISGQSYYVTHSQQFIEATNNLYGINENLNLESEEDRGLYYEADMLYTFDRNTSEKVVEVGMLMDQAKYNHYMAKTKEQNPKVDGYTWVFVLENLEKVCEKKNIVIKLDDKGTYTLGDKKGYEATERLSKLLGIDLFPEHIYVCTFKVPVKSLFRPAYQTSIYEPLLKDILCKTENDQPVKKWHWDTNALPAVNAQTLNSHDYLSPEKWLATLQKSTEYPWTRMGYTYDWSINENEKNKKAVVGVSEFVIIPDTGITDIKFYKEANLK